MRPALAVDAATRLLLDAIVANRRGRAETLFEVTLLEQFLLVGGMRPDPGEAVG